MISLRANFTGTGRVSLAGPIPPDMALFGTRPQPAPPADIVTGTEIAQLVTDWQDRRFPAGGLALVEQKHDGIRAIYHTGDVVTRTESPLRCAAKALPGLLGLERALGGPHVIDGEYVEPDGFAAAHRACMSGLAGDGAALFLWDAVPLAAWEGRASCPPLIERKAALRDALARASHPMLRYVAHAEIRDPAAIRAIAQEAWRRGHEGIVVKDATAIYHRGRNAAWQRLKRSMTADGVIVAVDGVDHPEGTMATLIVDVAGKRVRVVAGFSPAERRDLWAIWPRLIGRRVELEAMELTAAGSLRQPRFSMWKDKA